MPNPRKCKGEICPVKNYCVRYTNEKRGIPTDGLFHVIPFDDAEYTCREFWNNGDLGEVHSSLLVGVPGMRHVLAIIEMRGEFKWTKSQATRSEKMAAAGFTRRPTWHSLPPDD